MLGSGDLESAQNTLRQQVLSTKYLLPWRDCETGCRWIRQRQQQVILQERIFMENKGEVCAKVSWEVLIGMLVRGAKYWILITGS